MDDQEACLAFDKQSSGTTALQYGASSTGHDVLVYGSINGELPTVYDTLCSSQEGATSTVDGILDC